MGQTECKGCIGADPMTDTVKFDVGSTLLSAPADDKPAAHLAGAEAAVPSAKEVEDAESRVDAVAHVESSEEEEANAKANGVNEAETPSEEQRRQEDCGLARKEEQDGALQQEEARTTTQQRQQDEVALATADADVAGAEAARQDVQHRVDAFLRARGFKKGAAAAKTSFMRTTFPIHVAAQDNNADIVRALLECGADRKAKNGSGKTALDVAKKLNKNGSHDAVIAALS